LVHVAGSGTLIGDEFLEQFGCFFEPLLLLVAVDDQAGDGEALLANSFQLGSS
jgi:hypothetical protein